MALMTFRGGAYYHWLTEGLPRLGIIQEAGIAINEVDIYITNNLTNVMQESLDLAGVPREKRLTLKDNQSLQSENVIAPSFPGGPYNPGTSIPSLWTIRFLRYCFIRHSERSTGNLPRRFYIQRTGKRKVANESVILPLLKSKNIHMVRPEKLSFIDQVSLFFNAEVVVAPHGSGLANLVFASQYIQVVELFPYNQIRIPYWAIANRIGASYYYIMSEPVSSYKIQAEANFDQDIIIDPDKLKRTLDIILN